MNDLEKIYLKVIHGTKHNHPDWDMVKTIKKAIDDYIRDIDKSYGLDTFCGYFSTKDKSTDEKLRDELYNYELKNNCNIVLGLIDILYNFISISDYDNIYKNEFINNYKKCIGNKNNLVSNEEDILKNVSSLKELVKDIDKILIIYLSINNEKQVYKSDLIEIIDISKTGQSILTNCNNLLINNSYSGEVAKPNISISSDRGYIYKPTSPQQDAVLSIINDESCFLNVVTDGAGSADKSERASVYIINELKEWFINKNKDELRKMSYNEIKEEIRILLININNSLVVKYKGNCYATVVLALTVDDKTIICNVGDSTAYAYNEENDSLMLLSYMHSYSDGLSYEESRRNPDNNIVTKSVGSKLSPPYRDFGYFNLIEEKDNIDRIILSSDGVTDLVSERRFKDYFKNKTKANDIVKDAVFTPDIDEDIKKTSDNVSAIVIDLPNNMDRRLIRR